MNILVIGSGAREHAIAWKVVQSPLLKKLYVAPGNAGTAQIAENLPIKPTDLTALADAARKLRIDLTIVGPEAPLTEGIADSFHVQGLRIFGPARAAAQIEWSKAFAKELMQKHGIPCAQSRTFSTYDEARAYLQRHSLPVVVKADGLAAGKGVTVAHTRDEALQALSEFMEKKAFGAAGDKVIIEECLEGKEASVFAITDGATVLTTLPACDYKRALDYDQGPNTGGMGSYSPPEFFDIAVKQASAHILKQAVAAMAKEGRVYQGVLYAGLMITAHGPKVLEFNCRLGDPETQVILPRLKSDLLEVALATVEGRLQQVKLEWDQQPCVAVVLASGGYPGSYKTGFPIRGLESIDKDATVFHAGTRPVDGRVITDGGRVLTVVAKGKSMAEAREKVYANVARIHFEGMHYRRDIAERAVKSEARR